MNDDPWEYKDSFLQLHVFVPDSKATTDDIDKQHNAGLALDLDPYKTDQSNYNNKEDIKFAYISLEHLGVDSFECIDQGAIDEKLIMPKAVRFWFDSE